MSFELPIRTKPRRTGPTPVPEHPYVSRSGDADAFIPVPQTTDSSSSASSSTVYVAKFYVPEIEDINAITPVPQTAASSSTAFEASITAETRSLTSESGNTPVPWPQGRITTSLETMLGIPPNHPQNWIMPDDKALRATFVPEVALSIPRLEVYRNGTCFCTFAIQVAQIHVNKNSGIDLSQRPLNKTDFIATLRLFLTQATVDVFEAQCERFGELFNPIAVNGQLRQSTVARHVSTLLEQIASGTAVPVPSDDDAEEQQQSAPERTGRKWKLVKTFFKKARGKIHGKIDKLRHDSGVRMQDGQQPIPLRIRRLKAFF